MGANAFGQCGLGSGAVGEEGGATTSEGAASLAAAAASATNVWTPMTPGAFSCRAVVYKYEQGRRMIIYV
jgi:hypothetical protein